MKVISSSPMLVVPLYYDFIITLFGQFFYTTGVMICINNALLIFCLHRSKNDQENECVCVHVCVCVCVCVR